MAQDLARRYWPRQWHSAQRCTRGRSGSDRLRAGDEARRVGLTLLERREHHGFKPCCRRFQGLGCFPHHPLLIVGWLYASVLLLLDEFPGESRDRRLRQRDGRTDRRGSRSAAAWNDHSTGGTTADAGPRPLTTSGQMRRSRARATLGLTRTLVPDGSVGESFALSPRQTRDLIPLEILDYFGVAAVFGLGDGAARRNLLVRFHFG